MSAVVAIRFLFEAAKIREGLLTAKGSLPDLKKEKQPF